VKRLIKEPLECIIEDFVTESKEYDEDHYGDYYTPSPKETEVQNKFFRISKEEELHAVDYLKKMVMKYAVELFTIEYKHLVKFNTHILDNALERMNKSLKKMFYHKFIGKREKDIIWYETFPIIGDYKFIFNIYKDENGSLLVAYINPLNRVPKHFLVNTHNRLIPLYEVIISDDNTEKINYKLTKEEEQRGLQYIRNEVLPMALEEYGLAAKELNLPQVHYGPEEDSVIHSLRKIRHETFPNDLFDRAIYQAEFKKYKWIFMVEKICGHVRAGYIDPFFCESKLFDINFSISDPKRPAARSSFIRIKGYMPPQGGVGGGLINEVHSQGPYPSITPEEEKHAFQYIKRQIVPLFVQEYNSNARDDTTNITEGDITNNLKKYSIYYWPDRNIKTIYYVAMLPSDGFIFMIAKSYRRGNEVVRVGYHDPFSHKEHWFGIEGKILQEFKKLRELLKVEKRPLL